MVVTLDSGRTRDALCWSGKPTMGPLRRVGRPDRWWGVCKYEMMFRLLSMAALVTVSTHGYKCINYIHTNAEYKMWCMTKTQIL